MFYMRWCNASYAVGEICFLRQAGFIFIIVYLTSITVLLLITFVSHVTSSSALQENAHHQLQREHYLFEQQFAKNKCAFGPDYYFLLSWQFILSISSTFCFFFPFSEDILLMKFLCETIPKVALMRNMRPFTIRFKERHSELLTYAFCAFAGLCPPLVLWLRDGTPSLRWGLENRRCEAVSHQLHQELPEAPALLPWAQAAPLQSAGSQGHRDRATVGPCPALQCCPIHPGAAPAACPCLGAGQAVLLPCWDTAALAPRCHPAQL